MSKTDSTISVKLKTQCSHAQNGFLLKLKCCFTSTEIVGLLGTGAQDVHLDFHTALSSDFSSPSEASGEFVDSLKNNQKKSVNVGIFVHGDF